MKDLKSTKALVRSILEKDIQARNSDHILYLRVLQTISERRGDRVTSMTVAGFLDMLTTANCPYPAFETVRRSRQKIQAEYPYLCSCEKVTEFRAENEQAYREFVRS